MKKLIIIAVLLSFICIGIIGIMIMINSRIEEAALAGHEATVNEDNNNNQDTTESNSDKEDNENDSNASNDGDNSDSQEATNQVDGTINDSEVHINNIKDIMAEVSNVVYNFDNQTTEPVKNQDSIFVLVNKKNGLSETYIPSDLTVPNVKFSFEGNDPKKQMRKVAANALEDLMEASKEEGLEIVAVSGFRSYDRQKSIYTSNVGKMGEVEANKVSAKPGQSEHQTGLAMDVSCQSIGYGLEDTLGELPEGIWLAENAYKYGFIIRYPEDKTDITQYSYEPWHVRYVGKVLAAYLYDNHLTLDEFYEQLNN